MWISDTWIMRRRTDGHASSCTYTDAETSWCYPRTIYYPYADLVAISNYPYPDFVASRSYPYPDGNTSATIATGSNLWNGIGEGRSQ